MKPRVLRLLHAGGAPAGWLRHAGRAAARLGALDRGVAWAGELVRVSPSLRAASLWGDTLGALASSLPARASTDEGGGGPLPGGFPRRTSSPDASIPSRTDAAARTRAERRAPPSRCAPSADRGSSGSAAAFRSTPVAASLPRRASEGVLQRWISDSADVRAGGRTQRTSSASAPRAGVGGSMAAWDGHAALAGTSFLGAQAGGERRVWTPSPEALPVTTLRDRLHGWAADRAASRAVPEPAFARGGGDERWIARIASAAARRLPFSIARTKAASLAAAGPRDAVEREAEEVADSLLAPALDTLGAVLADEWGWPLDGPTVAAEVLARLADWVRAAAPPPTRRPPSAAQRGDDAPPTLRRPSSADRDRDDAPSTVRRPSRPVAWSGEGSSAALSPSPHPLFRPRRAAQAVAPSAERTASPFASPLHSSAPQRRSARMVTGDADRSISRFPSSFRSPVDSSEASGDAVPSVDGGVDARDRWGAWPAVLPWPRSEGRGSAVGAASTVARRSGDGDAATTAQPPRLARSVAGEAPLPAQPVADAARALSRRTPVLPAGPSSADADGDAPRDGWLIDTLRARSPQPGLAVEPGGATIPIHPTPVEETAELRGGIPGVLAGAPPLPWMAGAAAAHEADPLGQLDALAGQVRRILEDEVRRHGIDV